MLDVTRVFERCVLCGGAPPYASQSKRRSDQMPWMSREHLFGKSLADMMSRVQRPVQTKVLIQNRSGEQISTSGGGRSILNEVSVCLCICCNNGFSEVMQLAQPLIFGLATGTIEVLTPADKAALLRYFERFGFLADVLSSSHELTPKIMSSPHFKSSQWRTLPPVYSLDERRRWLQGGRTGSEPMIWLGRHAGVLGLNPMTSVDCTFSISSAGTVLHRRFHTVIRELAIEIQFRGEAMEPYNGLQSYVRLENSTAPMSWPPARLVGYEDFFKLHQQSEVISFLRAEFLDPISCIQREFETRRVTEPS
jgi:hypothetical protein